MKKKIFLYALIALTIINIGALSSILYYRIDMLDSTPHQMMRENGFERMQQELNLSSEQRKIFGELRTEMHSTIDSLSARIAGDRTMLIEELWKDDPDSIRIALLVENINNVQLTAQMRVVENFLSIKEILTPEQREIFYARVLQRYAEEDRHSPMRLR